MNKEEQIENFCKELAEVMLKHQITVKEFAWDIYKEHRSGVIHPHLYKDLKGNIIGIKMLNGENKLNKPIMVGEEEDEWVKKMFKK